MTEFADEGTGAEPIAIIGMSARVPGANDVDRFWRNLVDGVESVTFFSREEQVARGATEEQLDNPEFVRAAPVMEDMEGFDAAFFGMSPREAELADPQQRVFLEQSHAALVDSGYDPAAYEGAIGVYGGCGPSLYQWLNLSTNPEVAHGAIKMGISVSNNIDYVATTVSYRLNLRGPSLTVTTACSSSLVALHLACESLRTGECDMALAGGVCVELPHGQGYPAMEGFTSSDGHVRPFDASADGTIWGSGVGVVTLKRLSDALADGDHVRAVVVGNAINNDGSDKVGFSAPSAAGQAAVVTEALGVAGIDPRTIGYVEAHGTGTALGDPIEVAALSAVYGNGVTDKGWCGIGSVKSNIGHLSQASGVVGLIKAVLALEHAMIPPTINYERPNPAIDFDAGPFYPVTTLSKWHDQPHPRRAAISSFGIGGTNAHVVIEQAPPRGPIAASPASQVLRLSARTPGALEETRARLADYLREHPDLELADVVHTLRAGRASYAHRAVVVADDLADAATALKETKRCHTGQAADPAPPVTFMFSGQGAQYAGMGADLYRAEPVFAEALDECAAILTRELGEDLRPLILVKDEAADEALRQTRLTQPALFAFEYALARLWSSWGVEPAGMIGHSIGEYVAATVAGVFALPDALRLVAARGRLMQSMPPGSMLAVQQDEKDVAGTLPDGVTVATVNGPGTCVVAGPAEAVDAFAEELRSRGIKSTPLRTSHAFHSAMMDPILAEFAELVAAVPRQAPRLPFLSNLTGQWITAEQATDPAYWAAHLRNPVRFGDGVATLLADVPGTVLLECGPGKQLAGLARMQLREAVAQGALPPLASVPGPQERTGHLHTLYGTAGRLWVAGVPVEHPTAGRRVSLPGYPYEREYRFIAPGVVSAAVAVAAPEAPRSVDNWYEQPVWRQVSGAAPGQDLGRCLVFAAEARGEELAAALTAAGADVIPVRPGESFEAVDGGYTLRPGERADYDALVAALAEGGGVPERAVHAWSLAGEPAGTDIAAAERAQEYGFFSLLWLAQALAGAPGTDAIAVDVLTAGTEDVLGGDLTRPEHATVDGVARTVPMDIERLTVRHLDLDPAGTPTATVLAELRRPALGDVLALRSGRRWQRTFEQAELTPGGSALKEGGRYLITGGLGGIGVTLAEELGTRLRARLVLLSRTGLPPVEEWERQSGRTATTIATIRRLEAAGAEVLVVAADVTDPVRMREVRDQVVAAYGGLDGIVHAAGVAGGAMAELVQRADAQAVLAPKLAGTLALWQAFGDLDLDFVALCASVTGVCGGVGQVDYSAANSFLDAFARSMDGRPHRVLSLDWGGWLEVGMLAESLPPGSVAVRHPLLRSRLGMEVRGPIAADTHWVLDEHRIGDVPVLPGTGQLECARAAFAAAVPSPGPDHLVELRDVAFTAPLAVPDGTRGEVVVALSAGPAETGFEVRSGSGVHTSGAAAWVEPAPAPAVDVAGLLGRLRPVGDAAAPGGRKSVLTFGPRWSPPVRVWKDGADWVALIEAGELVAADVASGEWVLHPAMLDVATSFARGEGSGSYLPLGYGRLLVRGSLPARFYSHLRRRGGDQGGEVVSVDVTLIDESGAVLVAIEDYELRRVDADAVSSALPATAAPAVAPPAQPGIRPLDGVEAFQRVLAADLGPQVVISALSTGEITAREWRSIQAIQAPADAVEAGPLVQADGLAATLLRIWAEILGVPGIGADDDFFDMGGNSLVAVQLISQVRRAAGVRLPMRTLFEAPTVAEMVTRIETLQAAAVPEEPAVSAIPRLSRPAPRSERT